MESAISYSIFFVLVVVFSLWETRAARGFSYINTDRYYN